MKYIKLKNGFWDFSDYFEYVEKNEVLFPSSVYELSRKERNSIDGVNTLHDATITSFVYKTKASGNDSPYSQCLDLTIRLSSGRDILLNYHEVTEFELYNLVGCSPMPPIGVHEISHTDNKEFEHIFCLVSKDELRIVFGGLSITEV